MSRTRWVALGVICWLAASALLACGSASAPAVTPAGTGSPELLLQERCGVCHSLERITTAQKTPAEWESTVRRMVGKGAKLDDAEFATLVAYLAATFK